MTAVMQKPQGGATLIEVLITMVIMITGLLGLVALQARLQIAQIEAYQRAQAAVLVADISERMLANRIRVAQYVTTEVGTGSNCASLTAAGVRAQADIREWCDLLQGASTTLGGASVGTLTGGRGCVETISPGIEYRVAVVWQGLCPVPVPAKIGGTPTSCGVGLYDGATGTACTADACRRALVSTVRIAKLL